MHLYQVKYVVNLGMIDLFDLLYFDMHQSFVVICSQTLTYWEGLGIDGSDINAWAEVQGNNILIGKMIGFYIRTLNSL